MARNVELRATACRDLTATEVKKSLGHVLDQALRGECIRITRHGRSSERVVMIRESDLVLLQSRAGSPLEALRAEFERMLDAMQTPAARRAAARVGTASSKALGKAAVAEARKRG